LNEFFDKMITGAGESVAVVHDDKKIISGLRSWPCRRGVCGQRLNVKMPHEGRADIGSGTHSDCLATVLVQDDEHLGYRPPNGSKFIATMPEPTPNRGRRP
jgi:hypothetical protein